MTIADLIGKPYAHAGRGPDAFDCWGLCIEVYRRVGRSLPDYAYLSRTDMLRLVRSHSEAVADQVFDVRDYDIAMDTTRAHAGVFIGRSVLTVTAAHGVAFQPWMLFQTLHPDSRIFRCRT